MFAISWCLFSNLVGASWVLLIPEDLPIVEKSLKDVVLGRIEFFFKAFRGAVTTGRAL